MTRKHTVKPLPEIVGRYFDAWIRRSTWYTGHLTDDQFFYKFVRAVLQYCRKGKRPSESQIRELIESKGLETIKDPEYLRVKAERFSSLYASILEFHDTSFPEVLVERTRPVLCYYELERQCGNESEIDQCMKRLFGEDWKKLMEQ